MKNIKEEVVNYELIYYKGSLDFPCDFCGVNSYNNFHIYKDKISIIVCEDCLNKVKDDKKQ